MLERESSRERNLEKSAKEAKAKARRDAAARGGDPLDSVTEEDLRKVCEGVACMHVWVVGVCDALARACHNQAPHTPSLPCPTRCSLKRSSCARWRQADALGRGGAAQPPPTPTPTAW